MNLPRVSKRALSSVALAAVLVASVTGCNGTPPSKDAFYAPPVTITGNPGDILKSRTSVYSTDAFGGTAQAGVTAHQVMYRSTNATGQADAVTGTVLVPTAPWAGPGSRPLISYAVGTRGVGQDCAPSLTLSQGTDYEGSAIQSALTAGYAVAVTDYEGMGTPGPHTYMVGQSMGRAVLDMARAAERLPGTGLGASTPVGVWGYSEGGAAAGWAAELAPTYGAGINLKGVAMGGVPADLQAVANSLSGSAFVAFELMTAIGFNRAYPELNLASYLNPSGASLLASAQSTCLVSVDGIGTLLGTAFHPITDYVTTNPIPTPAWQARLDQNKLGNGRPTVPLYQYQADQDEIIPAAQANTLHTTYCAKGVNETYVTIPLAEHLLGMVEGAANALSFLGARFAGTPTSGNC